VAVSSTGSGGGGPGRWLAPLEYLAPETHDRGVALAGLDPSGGRRGGGGIVALDDAEGLEWARAGRDSYEQGTGGEQGAHDQTSLERIAPPRAATKA